MKKTSDAIECEILIENFESLLKKLKSKINNEGCLWLEFAMFDEADFNRPKRNILVLYAHFSDEFDEDDQYVGDWYPNAIYICDESSKTGFDEYIEYARRFTASLEQVRVV